MQFIRINNDTYFVKYKCKYKGSTESEIEALIKTKHKKGCDTVLKDHNFIIFADKVIDVVFEEINKT